MTEKKYYAAVRALGLRQHQNFRETFVTVNGEPHNVPLASQQTPEQRAETIEWLKESMGIKYRE
jgi:hypothetical protein